MSPRRIVHSGLLAWGLAVGLQPLPAAAQASASAPAAGSRGAAEARDGQHDFDFEIGTWKTHLKRLLRPLSGSTTWVEYEGTTVVRKVWNGRANLVELVAEGPAGRFEGLSLRLYNPEARQWSLNFANAKSGTLTVPTIGEFKGGRGEFYAQDTLNGRAILVRFVISDITPSSCRFEQAFSDDGGKTWEVNWIAVDTRIKD
ncbi:MAG TPA: hypothetical protein VFR85_13520 [Anaeromyxobacteraceae bacterium]|nr:hypothetical protein [Anaeromyxobacteraceae bacterium]